MIRMWGYILGNANSAFMKQCLTKKYALGMKAEVFKMKYNYDLNYQNGIHFFAFQIDNFVFF